MTLLFLSPSHTILVVIAVLLLFGGKKIPELMKGLGTGIKEFKDAVKEEDKKPEDSNKSENSN
jgi:sec-independent protein translocase protein TatA